MCMRPTKEHQETEQEDQENPADPILWINSKNSQLNM